MAPGMFHVIYVSDRNDVRFDEFEPILASAMGQGSIERIIIRAHTDSIGAADDNLALSRRWANDLKNWIVARGVPADVIEAQGIGESEPLETVPDETASALNQRIEIEIRFGG
jgi:outer membrane protein OmpA-like peptidoglycan-associated protein